MSEKDRYYMISLTCGFLKIQKNIYLQNRLRESELVVATEVRRGTLGVRG